MVFELTPNNDGTWAESTLHSFGNGNDGSILSCGLIFDASGNLYGTTQRGGAYGNGIVFELTPNGDGTWTENILYAFTGGDEGSQPFSALVFDSDGNLYGTAMYGGAHGNSVVFELSPQANGTWMEKVLHSFGTDGNQPQSALVFDSAGRLYGTTYSGGTHGEGVVFQLTPNSDGTWTRKVLHNFTGGKDGGNTNVGVTLDSAGNVYGVTENGGPNGSVRASHPAYYGHGVVFELVPTQTGGWKERLIHAFAGHGSDPEADVIFDAAGNIYGTTRIGNNNNGLVYEITP